MTKLDKLRDVLLPEAKKLANVLMSIRVQTVVNGADGHEKVGNEVNAALAAWAKFTEGRDGEK